MSSLLLLPTRSFCDWEGFLTVAQSEFFVRITVPTDVARAFASAQPPSKRCSALRLPISLKGSSLHCDPQLTQLLTAAPRLPALVEQRLAASHAIDAFAMELIDIVRPLLSQSHQQQHSNDTKLTANTVRLLNDLDWQTVVHVDDRLDQVHVKIIDAAQREHVVQLHFRDGYMRAPPLVRAATPLTLVLPPSVLSLRDAVEYCSNHIAQFQAVWRVLDEFDARCLVLEPPVPAAVRNVLARRIALGAHRTLSMLVDWQRPNAMPRECVLFGPESAVQPLRERLATAAQRWNNGASLADNFVSILGIELPSAATHARAEFAIECGICYAYRSALNNEDVPNAACNNERCGRAFHEACLFEWLRSIPSNTMTFDTIFGVCPYCSEKLSATARKR